MRQRIADTLQAAATQLQDTGLKEDLARLFREDPHPAERDLRDAVAGWARGLLGQAFAALDDHGDRLQIDGKSPRQVAASSGQATTLFGTLRGADRADSGSDHGWGRARRPVSRRRSWPACRRGMGADLWQRICGAGPATRSLIPPDGRGGAGI